MNNEHAHSETVAGYTIKKSIIFQNGKGFALGENPKEAQPYVTWQFTKGNGVRDYYWGHYTTDCQTAERDYAERIANYQRMYGVSERATQKPIAEQLAENAKQAARNNAARPIPEKKSDKDRD